MRILDVVQGSPEWFAARRGLPTASCFDQIITPARGDLAASAEGYIDRLIDELARPDAQEGFSGNRHTERGTELEPAARRAYAFLTGCQVEQVGLILSDDGQAGCSPDGLVIGSHGLEIKCPDGPTHCGYLRAGTLPAKYRPQVHGGLAITELDRWDFFSYCPGYRPFLVTVHRDDYTAKLQAALAAFVERYAKARALVLELAA